MRWSQLSSWATCPAILRSERNQFLKYVVITYFLITPKALFQALLQNEGVIPDFVITDLEMLIF